MVISMAINIIATILNLLTEYFFKIFLKNELRESISLSDASFKY